MTGMGYEIEKKLTILSGSQEQTEPMDILEINYENLSCDDPECSDPNTINTISSNDVSYERFFEDYLFKNRPCLIKDVSDEWKSQQRWVKDGKPDFDFLDSRYGNSTVPVANCKERFFNSQSKCSMKLSEFLNYWRNFIKENYDENADCFYMKDWHFANEYQNEAAYTVPKFFASDWINEYLVNGDQTKDDYRFVYMGPKGSWTPLHTDVFSSFSWSVNICGKKKWIFLPLGEEEKVKDKFGNLVYDLTSEELKDTASYPRYSKQIEQVVLIQGTGDAVFVPSGWHHQVWNLDDTISFNHNWVNGCNVMKMWNSMKGCFESVCQEISDCKDMEGWDDQCQLVLKSCFGMDFNDFYGFVASVAQTRIDHLRSRKVLRVSGNWAMGRKHMVFDLMKLRALLQIIASDSSVSFQVSEDMESLICRITNVLPDYRNKDHSSQECTIIT